MTRALALLGAALAATLAAATGVALRAVAPQGWWAAGYHRLVVDAVVARFDPAALAVGGVGLALAAAAALLARRRPARRTRRAGGTPTALGLAALGAVVGLRAAVALDAWRAAADGPNVLLVSIDTLRADRLGAYGYARPTSPTLDGALAARGVLFEDAYSQSPKTTPSHMTMLTSLYPSVHGVTMWEEGKAGPVLAPRVVTLAEVLKNAGWATAAFTGGANVDRRRGFDQGFDVYKHNRQLERARAWIAAHAGRKFFLFFHTFQVHDPYVPPPDLVREFVHDGSPAILAAVERLQREGSRGWWDAHRTFWAAADARRPEDVATVSALYDAGIRNMDATTLAPLLALVDALPRPTLVVFTSDHGEAFAEHGVFLHDDLWAGTVRVPLVLRFPGRLPAGRRVAGPVGVIDVMPTILDLVGVAGPPEMQGRSLVPRIGGAPAEPSQVVSEYSQPERPYVRLRRGPLVYLLDGGAEHLFAAADAAERSDLAGARPDLVGPLRAALAAWRTACAPLAVRLAAEGAVAPDAATLRQLRALGYVE